MTFKFQGKRVTITHDNELICEDEFTRDALIPLLGMTDSRPENGDPFIYLLSSIFGADSITDYEGDDEPWDMIY